MKAHVPLQFQNLQLLSSSWKPWLLETLFISCQLILLLGEAYK